MTCEIVNMGFGEVAVGIGVSKETGVPCIHYLKMDSPRTIGDSCEDVYVVGEVAAADRFLAVIYFHSRAAFQQSIDVLTAGMEKYYPEQQQALTDLSAVQHEIEPGYVEH